MTPPAFSDADSPASDWRREVGPALLLAAAIFLAYLPVWHAGFIWDDDAHLTANQCIVGPLGFKEIWTSSRAVYYPLVLTTFWLWHALWGLNPLAFHLLNLAAQAGCAILLWQVLRALRIPGAWLGSALWALHPVQVESAAWVTELKNTQSGIFYLLAILFFLRWRERKQGKAVSYGAALLCALLAILSKSSTVMLPVVLGLCWWWMEGRWRWRNAAWLAPFLGISVLASIWTIWEQKYAWGAMGPAWAQSRPERMVIAGKDIWFYLGKIAWPHPLIFIYPRWQVGAAHWADWLPLLAAAAGTLSLWRWKKGRPVFFAAAYFLVSIFPVLDFFNVYFFRYSFVGDHFQFLASMGPLALAGAVVARVAPTRNVYRVAAGALLALLGGLSYLQCGVYRNMETLWRDTLAHNPDCPIAHYNLGDVLVREGRLGEAEAQYAEDVRIDPASVEGKGNLANVLLMEGKADEAIARYREILLLQPNVAQVHGNLSMALLRRGQVAEAILHAREAVRLDAANPAYPRILAAAMAAAGQPRLDRDGRER